MAFQYLRRHVDRRAYHGLRHVLFLDQLLAKSKIGNFNYPVFEEDVGWLQIPVQNVGVEECRVGQPELLKDVECLCLRDLLFGSYHLVQRPPAAKLVHQIVIVGLLEHLVELDDAWVAHLTQDPDFVVDEFHQFGGLLKFVSVQYFNGVQSWFVLVFGPVDAAVLPCANLISQDVILDHIIHIYYIQISYSSIISSLYKQQFMNTFGISLFKEPEQFIAVYLGMHHSTQSFIHYVQTLLKRTKSPPIAITYTSFFLQHKSEEQLSLDIIRFISQLSDLSPGISMSSSLTGILDESSFLTQLRHNLTHKGMVKGRILQISRQMILNQLQQKYWQLMIKKIKETYYLSESKIQDYYRQIYGQQLNEDLQWVHNSFSLQYFQNCSNYEYKEHIVQVILDFQTHKIDNSQLEAYYTNVSSQKQIIFVILLLRTFLQASQVKESFEQFVTKFVKKIESSMHKNELIFSQYCKAHFIRYLQQAKNLLESLPADVQERVDQYWEQKKKQIGSLYCGSSLNQ